MKDLWRQIFVLEERVRKLACRYTLAEIISTREISPDEMLNHAADLIPSGYQHPQYTSACILFRGKEFSTPKFRQSIWNQNFPLVIEGKCAGAVEVAYPREWFWQSGNDGHHPVHLQ